MEEHQVKEKKLESRTFAQIIMNQRVDFLSMSTEFCESSTIFVCENKSYQRKYPLRNSYVLLHNSRQKMRTLFVVVLSVTHYWFWISFANGFLFKLKEKSPQHFNYYIYKCTPYTCRDVLSWVHNSHKMRVLEICSGIVM